MNLSDTALIEFGHSEDMGVWYGQYYHLRTAIPDGAYDIYVQYKLELRAFINENKRDSIWTVYYRNGKLQEVRPFSNGELNGENVFFSLRGSVTRSTFYVNGIDDSTVYYYESGAISMSCGRRDAELICKEFPDSAGAFMVNQPLFKTGCYNSTSKTCPSVVLKKNGKFYFTSTENSPRQNGTWVVHSDTLQLIYNYEINKENKNKKYVNYEFPAYRNVNETLQFLISKDTLILLPNQSGRNKYYGCDIFVFSSNP